MNNKKYQIFVSSTYDDLLDVRRGVMDCIHRMLHFPVGMELFGADDSEQWNVIKKTLEQTDFYICIIGHRYGSLAKDGRSYTEKEWDLAKAMGIPVWSFVQDRNVPTAPHERESDPALITKLEGFVDKVKESKMVDFWKKGSDLNEKVITALYKAFCEKDRPGWTRTLPSGSEMGTNTAVEKQLQVAYFLLDKRQEQFCQFVIQLCGSVEMSLEKLAKPFHFDLLISSSGRRLVIIENSEDIETMREKHRIENTWRSGSDCYGFFESNLVVMSGSLHRQFSAAIHSIQSRVSSLGEGTGSR